MNILNIDQTLLENLNGFFIGHSPIVDNIFKFLAVYLVYALPVVLILTWFLIKAREKRVALVMSMLSVVLSLFGLAKIVSNFWFRPRPNVSIVGLKEVFFHRPDYSFPSDHATALFSLTFALYFFGYKKAANWLLLFSLIITFSRVVIAVHYPLDIIGGAIVALIGSSVIYLLRKPLVRYVYEPVVCVLKKLRLA